MADDVARLVAVLEANIKGFTKGMDQARTLADRRFGQIERRMQQSERRFAGAFRNIGTALISGAAFIGITRFVSAVSDMAGKLQDTSDALGIGTDALQTWGILAGRAGVGQEQFNKALANFSQQLGEAQLKGAKHPLAQLLNNIGVGTQGTPEQVFLRFSDAIKNTASQTQRAALVSELLGQRYVALTGFIQQGSAALRAQGVEFARNGSIMTRESIAKIDELGDKWADLKRQFTAIGGNVLAGFADSFSQFSEQLTSPAFQAALHDFGRIMGEIAGIAAKLAPVLPNLLGALAGARVGRVAGTPGAIVGGVIGGLAPELFEQSAQSVEKLEAELREVKRTLDSLPAEGVALALQRIVALEKEIEQARAARSAAARAAGIPLARPSATPTASPTIDRSGTLAPISKDAEDDTEKFNRLYRDAMADLARDLTEGFADARKIEQDFVSGQFEAGREFRNESERNIRELIEAADQLEAQGVADRIAVIGDGFEYLAMAAMHGADAFENAVRQMVASLAVSGLREIFELLLKGVVGQGGFLGRLIEGRASGGRVFPGQPYVVGERGPELFSPDTAGTIIPKLPTASAVVGSRAMSVDLRQTIDLRGANGDATIAAIARQASLEGTALAVNTIRKQFPSLMIKAQRDSL